MRETKMIGGVEYTWQVPVKKKIKRRPEPLRLILRSLSPTGNLTIAFNKPIKVPRLFKDHILNQTSTEFDSESRKRHLDGNEVDHPFEILKEIIDVKLLNSDDYDSD